MNLHSLEPESSASANSAIPAFISRQALPFDGLIIIASRNAFVNPFFEVFLKKFQDFVCCSETR